MAKWKVKPKHSRILQISTYNARTLSTEETITEMEVELQRIKWDVIGLSEVRRRGENFIKLKSCHCFYHIREEDRSEGGIGFLIHKRLIANILSLKKISSRVAYLTLRLSTKYTLKIIQVYAPTSSRTDEEVEAFYEDVSLALRETNAHFTILCGDFNAKLGLKSDESETSLGNFGSDGRNERGETMLSFLLQNNLFQMKFLL